jgi:hypothetical protein
MADTRNINEALDTYDLSGLNNLNGNACVNVTSLTQANSSIKQRYDDTYYLYNQIGSAYGMHAGGLGNQTTNYKFSDFYQVDTRLNNNSTWGGHYPSGGPLYVGTWS